MFFNLPRFSSPPPLLLSVSNSELGHSPWGCVEYSQTHTMSLKFYWKLPKFSSIFIWNKIYFISGSNEAAQIDKILLQGILMKIIFDKMQKDRIKQELWMFTWGRNDSLRGWYLMDIWETRLSRESSISKQNKSIALFCPRDSTC